MQYVLAIPVPVNRSVAGPVDTMFHFISALSADGHRKLRDGYYETSYITQAIRFDDEHYAEEVANKLQLTAVVIFPSIINLPH